MLNPSQIIGQKYEIKNLLARGGMSEVYLATSKDFFPVVLKRLLPELAPKTVFVEMFKAEAKIISNLSNDNIVSFIDFVKDKNGYFIVTEFICGKNLLSINSGLNQVALVNRSDIAIALGLELCKALIHMHEKLWIHGDISPHNIMIGADGQLKLLDFGSAKTANTPANDLEIFNAKPRYMSPEQANQSTLDHRSDIFSLGLVLFEVMAGYALLTGAKENDIFSIRASSTPILLPYSKEFNPDLVIILERALQKNPARRYESCKDIYLDLLPLLKKAEAKAILQSTMQSLAPIKTKPFRDNSFKILPVFFLLIMLVACFYAITQISSMLPPLKSFVNNRINKNSIMPLLEEQPLPTKKKQTGFLNIVASPWANVFIEDQSFGATPMRPLSLPVGEYLVRLTNPDLSVVMLRLVKIYANKKTQLIVNLKNEG